MGRTTIPPKITIITPSLNADKFIEEAILSVLCQEYENVEHIVVDGGSTDGTLKILQKYPHLKWISAPDSGQSHAMNKGFRMSSGDIIGYLNADDMYLPGAFQAVIPWFERGMKFVVGNIKVVMNDGSFWINNARVGHLDMLKHWEPEAFCVNAVGYFYCREVQDNVGGFNEHNHFAMDLEFLLAASKHYEFKKIDSLLGVFRFIAGTVTNKSQKSAGVWTKKNFYFIDQFLAGMPEDYINEFEKQRERGYLQRKIWQYQDILREIDKAWKTHSSGSRLSLVMNKIRQERIRKTIARLLKEIESK